MLSVTLAYIKTNAFIANPKDVSVTLAYIKTNAFIANPKVSHLCAYI